MEAGHDDLPGPLALRGQGKAEILEQVRAAAAKSAPGTWIYGRNWDQNQWLAREFPQLGGPKVRELFVAEMLRLGEHYSPARERLRPGQALWWAVDKTDYPHDHHTMAETRLVPVVLTLIALADIRALAQGVTRTQVSEQIIVRLHREADAQGGVLSETDTALLLAYTPGHLSDLIGAYEKRTGEVVPRRGTVHDLGPTLTHKAVIARKVLRERKTTAQAARETNHTPESVDRYLLDLMRGYICLKRSQQTPEQTAFATGLSLPLVKEYAALIDELGLSDDNLPDTLQKVETTQSKRRKPRQK
jgi:hypothetical protein